MRMHLILLMAFCACGGQTTYKSVSTPVPQPAIAEPDSLTQVARLRVVEAVLRYRQMIFQNDTTQVDGCSVASAVGGEYRPLLQKDLLRLVSEPTACDAKLRKTGFTRRLTIRSIVGGSREAVVQVSYSGGGTYFHEEEFRVRKASSKPDGLWATTEMRIYGAMIVD